MSDTSRLTAAIERIATVYLPRAVKARNEAELRRWAARLAVYAARLAAPDDEPDADPVVASRTVLAVAPKATDPVSARAIVDNPAWGILNELGFSPADHVTYGEDGSVTARAIDSSAVLAVASPQQVRELALLGFFGQPGLHPDVDYSLFEQYYEPIAGHPGSWQPKNPGESAWALYQASR